MKNKAILLAFSLIFFSAISPGIAKSDDAGKVSKKAFKKASVSIKSKTNGKISQTDKEKLEHKREVEKKYLEQEAKDMRRYDSEDRNMDFAPDSNKYSHWHPGSLDPFDFDDKNYYDDPGNHLTRDDLELDEFMHRGQIDDDKEIDFGQHYWDFNMGEGFMNSMDRLMY